MGSKEENTMYQVKNGILHKDGKPVIGMGVGTSKKRAEQDAARVAIATLWPDKIL